MKTYLSVSFSALLWLVLCQIGFSLLQRAEIDRLSTTIQSNLKSTLRTDNFNSAIAEISNLESLGIIACSKLSLVKEIPVEILTPIKTDCSTSLLHPTGEFIALNIKTSGGNLYTLQSFLKNSKFFVFSLWSTRLVGLFLLGSIIFFVRLRLKTMEALSSQATQVVHDIRSPLTALDMALSDIPELSENKRILIRNASQRIHDIANNLLRKNFHKKKGEKQKSKEDTTQVTTTLLSSLVETITSEKRSQFRSKIEIEINQVLDADSYGLFAEVNPSELKRIISNLVNNSVEAITGPGRIEIGLSDGLLFVKDNGKGIPPEVLAKFGEKGVSYGKEGTQSGSGLGVYHAKTTVESWGGQLYATSILNKGATFTLKLPLVEPPSWFVSSLELTPNTQIVVLDDDVSIHQIWKERLETLKNKKNQYEIFSLSTTEDLQTWVKNNKTDNALFLCDYELIGSKKTGLDIIEELKLQKRSILVTSRFEEDEIKNRCIKLGVRCIPKGLANLVPIKNLQQEHLDAILIDDDELVHTTWTISARLHFKKIEVFFAVNDFLKVQKRFSPSTKIFIDSNLDNNERGDLRAQEIYDLGFRQIFICTGSPEEFDKRKPDYIKDVFGKKPPWAI